MGSGKGRGRVGGTRVELDRSWGRIRSRYIQNKVKGEQGQGLPRDGTCGDGARREGAVKSITRAR